MDDATAEKIARNNAVFREANDEIESAAVRHHLGADGAVPFICECSDRRCFEIILLTLDQYRRVRSNPRWFAHAVGHEELIQGAIEPVEKHPAFVVVEKIEHAGEIAARLAQEAEAE